MKVQERLNDREEALRMAFDGLQSGIWTALPGIIQSFDAGKLTCVVQPSIQAQLTDKEEKVTLVNLPLLTDVPVFFPYGGSVFLTFPIAAGDECLVVFSSRCIDAWWQSGGVQPQVDLRMHDLSDAIAFVGLFSQPNVLSAVSTTKAQLRSKTGTTYVELDPAAQTLHLKSPVSITLEAPTVAVVGNLTISGTTVGQQEGTFNGSHTVSAHTHPGVTSGPSSTGTPMG